MGELTHAQVHVLLDIGINTSIKAGVLYIDQNVLDDDNDEDEQMEMLFVHPEPEGKQ